MALVRVTVKTGKTPPPVSKLPKLDKAGWDALVKATGVPRLVTDATASATKAAHDKAAAAHLAALQALCKGRKGSLAAVVAAKQKPSAAPHIAFVDRKGAKHSVPTLHRDAMLRDAVLARALLSSRANQAQTHAATLLRATALAGGKVKALQALALIPKAFDTAKSPVKTIDTAIGHLVDIGRDLLPGLAIAGGANPTSCGKEEGTGTSGDMVGCDQSLAPDPMGLLKNANWPLKGHNTCVRNQGARGTCPAFSVTAAVESAASVKYNRCVNLSEQDLYKHMRHDWCPFDDYDDGFAPPVSLLFQMIGQYKFPFEKDWDYNPALSRQDDTAHRTYSHSCDGYTNGNCSDTNHESHQTCYEVDKEVQKTIVSTVSTWVETAVTVVDDVVNLWGKVTGTSTHNETIGQWVDEQVTKVVTDIVSTQVCVFDTNIAGTSGIGVGLATVLWDSFTDAATGIALAKLCLASRVPVVFCLYAMPSFCSPGPAGYVAYPGPNEQPDPGTQVGDLGHCVLITGFVDNAGLPAGAPPGSGGGYFIVKNSWGTGYGDCGYAYLPYDWATQWGQVMVSIDQLTP